MSGTGNSVGRYFSVVSVLPSILLTVYVFLLFNSGSWRHAPDWQAAFAALRNIGITGGTLLAVSGIVVALVMHPLQFSMVQFLEGYWGPGRLARQIRVSLIYRHRRRRVWLNRLSAGTAPTLKRFEQEDPTLDELGPKEIEQLKVRALTRRDEANRSRNEYPINPDHTMPTRLGNMLRRYEILAGAPYELDAPTLLRASPWSHRPGTWITSMISVRHWTLPCVRV